MTGTIERAVEYQHRVAVGVPLIAEAFSVPAPPHGTSRLKGSKASRVKEYLQRNRAK